MSAPQSNSTPAAPTAATLTGSYKFSSTVLSAPHSSEAKHKKFIRRSQASRAAEHTGAEWQLRLTQESMIIHRSSGRSNRTGLCGLNDWARVAEPIQAGHVKSSPMRLSDVTQAGCATECHLLLWDGGDAHISNRFESQQQQEEPVKGCEQCYVTLVTMQHFDAICN